MTNEKKNMPETTEAMPLTDDQLEDVTGGAVVTVRIMQNTYLKCAVDPRHTWTTGAKVCPVCGSTKFIRIGRQG